MNATILCLKCGQNKQQSDFYPDKSKPSGIKKPCRQCTDTNNKRWATENPEKIKAASRARYAANPEKTKIKLRNWAKNNPEKQKMKRHRRRSNRGHAVPQRWTSTTHEPHNCYWCGKQLSENPHQDHIMPVSLHGSSEPKNLVPVCQTCNAQKKNKHPLVWIAELVVI